MPQECESNVPKRMNGAYCDFGTFTKYFLFFDIFTTINKYRKLFYLFFEQIYIFLLDTIKVEVLQLDQNDSKQVGVA